MTRLMPPSSTLSTLRVSVVVAATESARQRGLMGVPRIADGYGMLFVMDGPDTRGFWNAGTLAPLDVTYLDAHYRILTTLPLPTIRETAGRVVRQPDQPPYIFVLETNRGWLWRLGARPGDLIQPQPALA